MIQDRKVDLDGATRSVTAALRAFERELEAFVQTLAHGAVLVSLDPRFATVDYGVEDELHSSVSCVGVVCTNPATIAQGRRLHAAKEKLQQVCSPLHRHRMRVRVGGANGEVGVRMTSLVRDVLRNIGRSPLNLLAAYRRVRRMTRDALLERLQFSDKPGAAADRARLRRSTDSHLALVDRHAASVRANIWFQSRDARNRDCRQLSAELPLIYRGGRRPALPEIVYPDPAGWARDADGPRRPRATKLEPEAFLRTLPVFRYRPAPPRR